jgi:kynurenine formamidase
VVAAEPSLLEIQKILSEKRFVDLTHAFGPGIPHWHGFPDEKRETIYWYVKKWESDHGPIPKGAFVAMRTDWSKRWPDSAAMANKDAKGIAHYPGWTMEALKYLYEERQITASGHETTDTDPGIATSKNDYSLEAYLLGTDHYQIELLANLDQVPESGALIIVSFPKPKGGSGFPARVFAICPP